jgi:hypothetical protein
VFPDVIENRMSTRYMSERAILPTRNEHIDGLDAKMIDMFLLKKNVL